MTLGRVLSSIIIAISLLCPHALSQIELVGTTYFPADLEFAELGPVRSERNLESGDSLRELSEGPVYSEVGFRRYRQRVYEVKPADRLTIEIVTLKDSKAAYSLLTLFRTADIRPGPPGDYLSSQGNALLFTRSNVLVRIDTEAGGDLARRVGLSVGNRIGRSEPEPSLISSLPQLGCDASSVRYFLGPIAQERYKGSLARRGLLLADEVEIAQARYAMEQRTGILSLVSFPTSQSADVFFSEILGKEDLQSKRGQQIYLKKAGPLLGILEGDFEPKLAELLLAGIEFRYSIKWIFDKNAQSMGGLLGASGGILRTVVRSLLFTSLLCGTCIIAGICLATFRLVLRGYAPHNYLDRPERTEIIRLKIDEN